MEQNQTLNPANAQCRWSRALEVETWLGHQQGLSLPAWRRRIAVAVPSGEPGALTCHSGVYLHPAYSKIEALEDKENKHMKFLITLTLLTSAVSLNAANVTYVDHDKVAAALNKSATLVTAPDLTVSGSHRDKAGQVELHQKETDVIHVIDGEATFVTGGTMVGGKSTKAGQQVGSDIKGGETHHLTKGDVIVVPAGTPHWFKEVPNSISYYVVKVLKP